MYVYVRVCSRYWIADAHIYETYILLVINRLQRRLLSGAFFNHVLLNNFDSKVARVLVVVSKFRQNICLIKV